VIDEPTPLLDRLERAMIEREAGDQVLAAE
jgi:hypothetical protein